MSEPLLFEKEGPVVTLTINRPEARNPLGAPEDAGNFTDAVARINADRDVRCVRAATVSAARVSISASAIAMASTVS